MMDGAQAEKVIKTALDGKLFGIDISTGRVVMRKVPLDHIPTHRSVIQDDYSKLSEAIKAVKANHWLPEEDNRLIVMRERGISWESIRKMMQRGEKSIKERYVKLCQERGIVPLIMPSVPAPSLTNEAKAEIVLLRMQGVPFAQIAESVKRPTYQVVDYFNRFRASKRIKEEVA